MKKITLAALVIALFSFTGPSVKEGLEASFSRNYPTAQNVHWTDDQDGYTVSFIEKTVLTRINYDKNGKFTGSIRNYTEQFLPFYLTTVLTQKYPGQAIYGITEIASPTDIVYFVKLESEKYWTSIRLDNDGNTKVIERYKKG